MTTNAFASRLSRESASALFRPAAMERMIGHYRRLLEMLLDQPALPVGRLNSLTHAEQGVARPAHQLS